MCQEHTFIEIVGEAGVIAGAAGLGFGPWGFDSREPLGLAQLLDQETFVTALLGYKMTQLVGPIMVITQITNGEIE